MERYSNGRSTIIRFAKDYHFGNDLFLKNRGFSLVELLLIMVVVGILIALCLPAFVASRRKAQQSACASNLANLNHSLSLYLADNDGIYPPIMSEPVVNHSITNQSLEWSNLLQPYISSHDFPSCPAHELPPYLQGALRNTGPFCGYAINLNLNGGIGSKDRYWMQGFRENILTYPSCVVTFTDARAGIEFAARPETIHSWQEMREYYGGRIDVTYFDLFLQLTPGALRHQGGANYAFADGHIKWFKPEQLRTDKKSDGIHPGFGL